MTDLQWTAAVVAAFLAATCLLWRRAKKDMLGAITLSLLLVMLAAVLLVVSGCTISQARRPWMEAGIAWDREGAVGHNPACIVRVRAPIGPRGREEWIVAGFTHHSSCPDQHDRGEVNQIEITATIPLGRRQ